MDSNASVKNIQSNLLKWFVDNGRHWIPWKLKKDLSLPNSGECISPYEIWIAEIMLQQTQLKVVLPYWEKWMAAFPTLFDLFEADQQKILFYWQGLGYYSRANRIHNASKILVNLIGKDNILNTSCWPVDINVWMTLPGVGRSTAGSIISSAFDLPVPILDGNVKRIISRLFACKKPPQQNQKLLWQLSNILLDTNSPRNFNQALMDLGSTICTVQNPSCISCPLKCFCLAYLKSDPINFPTKKMKKSSPTFQIGLGLVFKKGELLIAQRLEKSSMGGMWEFPGGKKENGESIINTIEREVKEEIGIVIKVGKKLLSFEHSYSHKKLCFTVHLCEYISGVSQPLASQKLCWINPNKLSNFPFPAANTKIILELQKYLDNAN